MADALVLGTSSERVRVRTSSPAPEGPCVDVVRARTGGLFWERSGVEYVLVQPAEGFLHAGEGQG